MGQCAGALPSGLQSLRQEEATPEELEEEVTAQELEARLHHDTDGWLTSEDLAKSLQKFLRKRLKKRKPEEEEGLVVEEQKRLLSESDVCGPVVSFAQQSLVTWLCASLFFTVAYCAMEQSPSEACGSGKEVTGFVQYPDWLIYIGALPVLHIWWVQNKCLQYMVLPQVLLLEDKAFKTLWIKTSYRTWRYIQMALTSTNVMDIVAQCLFFAQFLRSVQYNPRILEEWRTTVSASLLENIVVPPLLPFFENLVWLFSLSFCLMFFQVIVMVLHMCPMEGEGVDYRFESMKEDGYSTVASYLASKLFCYQGVNSWQPQSTNSNGTGSAQPSEVGRANSNGTGSAQPSEVGRTNSNKSRVIERRERFSRHADVVRWLSAFGRMPALISSKAEVARLSIEGDAVRYVQIAHNRLYDRLGKVLLMDLFEKMPKLQVQITLLSLDLGLDMGVHDAASRQMFISCALSFFSCGLSCWNHMVSLYHFFWNMDFKGKEESDTYKAKDDKEKKSRHKYINSSICRVSIVAVLYGFCVLVLMVVQLHAGVKLYMVFGECHGPWNLNGCVAHGNFEEGSPEDLTVAEGLTVT